MKGRDVIRSSIFLPQRSLMLRFTWGYSLHTYDVVPMWARAMRLRRIEGIVTEVRYESLMEAVKLEHLSKSKEPWVRHREIVFRAAGISTSQGNITIMMFNSQSLCGLGMRWSANGGSCFLEQVTYNRESGIPISIHFARFSHALVRYIDTMYLNFHRWLLRLEIFGDKNGFFSHPNPNP